MPRPKMPTTNASLTPSESLANFTNRVNEQEAFRRLLNTPKDTPVPILHFYGVGGVGKSWTLKKLKELAQGESLPTALVDLEALPSIIDRPVQSLIRFREQLSQFDMPSFDLALAWYLKKIGHSKGDPKWKLGGPADLIIDAIDALGGVPLLGKGIKALGKKFDGSAVQRYLNELSGQQDWEVLRKGDPEHIRSQLTARFRYDFANAPYPNEITDDRRQFMPKAVLFLDTTEVLRQAVGKNAAGLHEEERWITELHFADSPYLIVTAGRDKLRWGETDAGYAERDALEQHLVAGLSENDARDFLQKCSIVDERLQDAILAITRDDKTTDKKEAGHHPFTLGLCADTVDADQRNGVRTDPDSFDLSLRDINRLAERFLKSLADEAQELWIRKLALPPKFDELAARKMFSNNDGVEQETVWANLLRFSFLQPSTEEPGWFTLHSRMTEALQETLSKEQHDPLHTAWQKHWQSRSLEPSDKFAGLAWFHGYQLNAESAFQEWNEKIEAAHNQSNMQEHARFLEWTDALKFETRVLHSYELSHVYCTAVEHANCTQGSRASHLLVAIRLYSSVLLQYDERQFGYDWAMTQNNLGNAYSALPTGDRGANLQKAIAYYQAALRIYTEADFPQDWAMIQCNLGVECWNSPTGDRGANLQQAIKFYDHALRVCTEADFPQQWATIQNNLGSTYRDLPTGDRGANLQQAIACYHAALRVRTEADFPLDWAMTQNNLGTVYSDLPSGDRGANLQQAIACYHAALRVYTEADFPQQWAMTQINLGSVYSDLTLADPGANLQQVIAYYQAALRVYTEADYPQQWAMTQNNLGIAYTDILTGDREANLQKAIACYQAALRSYTEANFPQDWAMTQNNLGTAYGDMPTGDRGANLQLVITFFQAALRVYTEADFPQDWAMTQHNLGTAYRDMPTGDRGTNLQQAIAFYRAALRARTEVNFPLTYATTQINLGNAYHNLPTGDRGVNMQQAIACYQAAVRGFDSVGIKTESASIRNRIDQIHEELRGLDGH